MRAGRPSLTSDGNTAVRAREMRKPAEERICSDPFAPHFLSPFFMRLRRHPWLGKAYGWLAERRCPGLRGGILARTRYIDERTTACLADGIGQLVILGAGNDSRGYRLVEPGSGVRVFEVDHPATQAVKCEKVRNLFGAIPPHVTFVPVDFCRDDLHRRLDESGYEPDRKTLFIMEGVIYYLTAAAVDDTLRFVTHCSASGSSIVFDYFPLPVINGTCTRKESINMRRRVAGMGEPFLFGIRDEEIEEFLRERGFRQFEITDSSACKEAWFHGANGAIRVTDIFRFVHAAHL